MLLKNNPVENTIYSNGVYPLLVASLGLGTLSLGQIGAANIRIWEVLIGTFVMTYLSFVGLIVGGLTYATHMLNFFWFSCGLLFALYQYKKTSVTNEGRNIKNDHD